MNDEIAALLDRYQRGDRQALARILTRVEALDAAIPSAPPPGANAPTHKTLVVGITGSGGAGKSTLVAALAGHLRKAGRRVAVLACDPASPRTGGALLGDRVRMQFDPADEGLYFRSLSTRGEPGGISAAVRPALPWLAAFGFDVVLIETVGVGQDQTAVHDVADRLLLLVTPGTGDEVQWQKAGLIELADVVAVNKSDMPGADRVRQELQQMLALSPHTADVPVLHVTASTGQGLEALWATIASDTTQS
jgi:LAO/AO transport system kinase